MLHLKIVHHFLHARQINNVFIEEANHIYIAIPMYIGLKTAFYQVLETLEKQTLIDRYNRR